MQKNHLTTKLFLAFSALLVATLAVTVETQIVGGDTFGSSDPANDSSPRPGGRMAYINIPTAIKDPTDTFSLSVRAIGVQIYKATEVAPNQFEWVLRAPEAELFDSEGCLIGKHFLDEVSGGPAWVLNDGSKVVANAAKDVVKRHQVANSIPWLRLPKKENKGNGALSQINSIHRLQTLGGKPPLLPPNRSQRGKELRVYYTATYYFNK